MIEETTLLKRIEYLEGKIKEKDEILGIMTVDSELDDSSALRDGSKLKVVRDILDFSEKTYSRNLRIVGVVIPKKVFDMFMSDCVGYDGSKVDMLMGYPVSWQDGISNVRFVVEEWE